MSVEVLLVLVVLAAAVCLIIQSLAVWQAAKTMQRVLDDVDRRTKALEDEASRLMTQASEVAEKLEPLGSLSTDLKKHFQEIGSLFEKRSRDVDALISEIIEVGKKQAVKIDFVVTDTVEKFEQTTEVIQRDILRPAVEISSFLKGFKTVFSHLFRQESERKRESQKKEEEMFI